MLKDKKLSITFVTNNWTPFAAGVVSSINAFRQELQRQGHKVTLITLDFLGNRHSKEDGVIRIFCPVRFTYKGNQLAVPFAANRQIKNIINDLRPDIIHSHHPFLVGISALKAARAYNIPCVFQYHSLYEKYTHYVPLPQAMVKALVRIRVRRYCNAVDGIITPSRVTERLLERDGITTPHILLPSPIQPIYFQDDGCLQRAQGTPFHLVTCSRFVKEKNLFAMLDVFAQLNPSKYKLTLAGCGGDQLQALKEYAYTTLGLPHDAVTFAVDLPKKQLVNLYRSADLFLFTSLADVQGLVLAEAMASGLPVVALDGPGQEDIVVTGENGFLVAGIKEMAHVIEKISDDFALHETLRVNALQTAKKYEPAVLTQKLVGFYRSFL